MALMPMFFPTDLVEQPCYGNHETIMEETEMSNIPRIRNMMLSMALALGSMAAHSTAWAQDATPPADPAPIADAASDANLSMGADAAPADGVGSSYVAANFEQWEQRCIKTEDGADPCQLYQLLKDAQGNSVAEYSMFPLKDSGKAVAGATIVVPLETLLTENLTLAIDTGKAKIYPYSFCTKVGCVARVGFTAEELAQFRKGANAILTIVPVVAPTEKVTLTLSLKGFTAGFDAVTATMPKPAAP